MASSGGMSRTKIMGAALIALVMVIVGGVVAWKKTRPEPVEVVDVNGYLGGEKIGLFDDDEFKSIMADNGLNVKYRKAGSLAMMDADSSGMDYLFPSSRAAVDYGESRGVDTSRDDIVFNSPIVVYTYKPVADALEASGLVSTGEDGVRTLDMAQMVSAMVDGKSWADVGYTEGYGDLRIDSTDPVKSNSGNEYAALVATMLNGGQPASAESVKRDADKITAIFGKSGWMETSSEDSFTQFLTLGVGAKPMMVGYESQVLDLAVNQPSSWAQVKDSLVVLYPTPTVWSTHVFIPLTDTGQKTLDVLKSDEVKKLAWERHGFRSSNQLGTTSAEDAFNVSGIMGTVTSVVELPDTAAMNELISTLQGGEQDGDQE